MIVPPRSMPLGLGLGLTGGGSGSAMGSPLYGQESDGGDYSLVSDAADLDPGVGDFTVMAWVYYDDGGSDGGVVAKRNQSGGDGWQIYINASGIPTCSIWVTSGYGVSGTTDIRAAWHHLAMTIERSGPTITLYVDGVSEGTPSTSLPAGDHRTALNMAIQEFPDTGRPWKGIITQIRMGAVARTQPQVASDMLSRRAVGWESNYWQMQPGTGATVRNEVNAANSAAFAGGANQPTWSGPYRRFTSGGPS
jgi:hypothetical protein